MSFLLDALRKSERAERQRSVPTIHSETSLETGSERENVTVPLLGMLLPAFLLMCWFGLQQFGHTPGAASLTTGADPGGNVALTQPAANPNPGRSEPAATVTLADPEAQVEAGHQDTSSTSRTPVEQFAVPESDPLRESEAQRLAASPGNSRTTVERPVDPPVARPRPEVGSAAPAGVMPESKPKTEPEPRQNHIDYWELPGNVREQLPQFRMSVLVYAERPADRFILINGRRRFEGDELQQGLVLREIHREGAVFSYRNYRFMVTQ